MRRRKDSKVFVTLAPTRSDNRTLSRGGHLANWGLYSDKIIHTGAILGGY